jgi:hypothetical protein
MASTMSGVIAKNIQIIKLFSQSSLLQTSSKKLNLESSKLRSIVNNFNTQQNQLTYIVTVQWNVSIILQRLGYSSSSAAFNSLTSQISTATADGSLANSLQSNNPSFSGTSVSNIFYNILIPSYKPTNKPSYKPSYKPSSSTNNSSSSDNLGRNIGIAIGENNYFNLIIIITYIILKLLL